MTMMGDMLVGMFKKITTYENVDAATGQKRLSKSYQLHVSYPDGLVLPVAIYFPRSETYKDPQLALDQIYAFPVQIRAKKDGKGITYTARDDAYPMPTK
jgi:hypothetical protein